MNKKILSGVLAAASMLSVSMAASAASTSSDASSSTSSAATSETYSGGKTYNVSAKVDYGTVDVTVPVALNNVIINPYGAAVKTELADGTKIGNRSAIASEVYTVHNNDATDGIKVMASVSVTKATGVVIKDMSLDKTSVKGYNTDDTKGITTGCAALDSFNPLVDYTAIKTATDKDTKKVSYVSGGDVAASTAQKKNFAIRVYGIAGADGDEATVLPTYKTDAKTGVVTKTAPKNTKVINFLPKGVTTDTLGTADASQNVFFTLDGDMNPEIGADATWGTEALSLSIVLKVLPVVADA